MTGMKVKNTDWKRWIFENGSYKLVALFVTLILWVTILGRRDIELSKELAIEYLLPKAMTVAAGPDRTEVDRHVVVKVAGPNAQLKRFREQPPVITIDLSKSLPGPVQAVVTPRSIEVPRGVRVISVGPSVISVTIIPQPEESGKIPSTAPREEK